MKQRCKLLINHVFFKKIHASRRVRVGHGPAFVVYNEGPNLLALCHPLQAPAASLGLAFVCARVRGSETGSIRAASTTTQSVLPEIS